MNRIIVKGRKKAETDKKIHAKNSSEHLHLPTHFCYTLSSANTDCIGASTEITTKKNETTKTQFSNTCTPLRLPVKEHNRWAIVCMCLCSWQWLLSASYFSFRCMRVCMHWVTTKRICHDWRMYHSPYTYNSQLKNYTKTYNGNELTQQIPLYLVGFKCMAECYVRFLFLLWHFIFLRPRKIEFDFFIA